MPTIGQPIELRDVEGECHQSRVEDVQGDVLTVARPNDLRVGELYSDGTHFSVEWAAERGTFLLPAVLQRTRTDGPLRLWDLQVTGSLERQQRRSYVRVPVSGDVQLTWPTLTSGARTFYMAHLAASPDDSDNEDDDLAGLVLEGQLLDVSEAAIACELPTLSSDPRLLKGTAVTVEFRLLLESFALDGAILLARAGTKTRSARVVVAFAHTDAEADRLRSQVFTIQRQLRQAARNQEH